MPHVGGARNGLRGKLALQWHWKKWYKKIMKRLIVHTAWSHCFFLVEIIFKQLPRDYITGTGKIFENIGRTLNIVVQIPTDIKGASWLSVPVCCLLQSTLNSTRDFTEY